MILTILDKKCISVDEYFLSVIFLTVCSAGVRKVKSVKEYSASFNIRMFSERFLTFSDFPVLTIFSGMGVVMRGYDPALDRHSAIKGYLNAEILLAMLIDSGELSEKQPGEMQFWYELA